MTYQEQLAFEIATQGWLKRGDFMLSCGKRSNMYVDLRPAVHSTRYMDLIITAVYPALHDVIRQSVHDGVAPALCGVVMSGVPLVGSLMARLAATSMYPMRSCLARTLPRDHGTLNKVEGPVVAGDRVIVIDDVATSGKSIGRTIQVLRESALIVEHALVVLDRLDGAEAYLDGYGVKLTSVLTLADVLSHMPQVEVA